MFKKNLVKKLATIGLSGALTTALSIAAFAQPGGVPGVDKTRDFSSETGEVIMLDSETDSDTDQTLSAPPFGQKPGMMPPAPPEDGEEPPEKPEGDEAPERPENLPEGVEPPEKPEDLPEGVEPPEKPEDLPEGVEPPEKPEDLPEGIEPPEKPENSDEDEDTEETSTVSRNLAPAKANAGRTGIMQRAVNAVQNLASSVGNWFNGIFNRQG